MSTSDELLTQLREVAIAAGLHELGWDTFDWTTEQWEAYECFKGLLEAGRRATVICRRCDPPVYMHPDQLDAHNEERHDASEGMPTDVDDDRPTCPRCKELNDPKASYCANCGKRVKP